MLDDLSLRYILKQKAEKYNKDQQSLHVNTYVFKAVQLMLLVLVVFFLVFFFLAPIATPFFLKAGIVSDAIAITFSGCFFSIIILVLLIMYFKKARKALARKKELIYSENALLSGDESQFAELEHKNELPDDLQQQLDVAAKPKKSRFSGFTKIIPAIKDVVGLLLSRIFCQVSPPDRIYFDEKQLDCAVNILNKLAGKKNFLLKKTEIFEFFPAYSSRWLENLLFSLLKIDVIKLTTLETNEKVVLLDLDFYDPADNKK